MEWRTYFHEKPLCNTLKVYTCNTFLVVRFQFGQLFVSIKSFPSRKSWCPETECKTRFQASLWTKTRRKNLVSITIWCMMIPKSLFSKRAAHLPDWYLIILTETKNIEKETSICYTCVPKGPLSASHEQINPSK